MTDYEIAIELAKLLNKLLGRVKEHGRVTVFEIVTHQFCQHCGEKLGDGKVCHCTNDE